jgi:hypothetical protein
MKSSCTKKVISTFCELIKKDTFTIAEMCAKTGISERSYYKWKKENTVFADALKDADDESISMRLVECKNSLVKLVNGFDYEEKQTEVEIGTDGKPKPSKIKTTKKHIQPNLGAIIHFQTNKDPESWKNRQSVDADIKVNSFSELMKKVNERKKDE